MNPGRTDLWQWAYAHELPVRIGRGRGVTIALLDDGVSRRVEPLRGATIVARDFVRTGPSGGHGTMCAVALVGRCEHYVGLVPDATLLAARVRGPGQGTEPLQQALRWLLKERPDVVCMPMGRGRSCPHVGALLRRLRERGVDIVASAGNRSPDQMLYPASSRYVDAVTAVDEHGEVASNCYRGGGAARLFAVDVPTWGLEGPTTFGRTSAAAVLAAGLRASEVGMCLGASG